MSSRSMKLIAFSAAAVLLCGCTDAPAENDDASSSREQVTESISSEASKTDPAEKEKTTEKNTETSKPVSQKDTKKYETGDCMPVLSIETNSKSDNVMDFVTKPVADHVSEAISTWTPGYIKPPVPYYEECRITLTAPGGGTLFSNADAQVKVRGNWTTVYDKKPLRIKFGQRQAMDGLNEGAEMKNWVLLAGYKDGSLSRDKAALSASREILGKDGLFAADAEFVEVEINGEYWGVYLLADMQQVNKHRIDITSPEKDYQGTDIGYFMEYDGYYMNEDELHSVFVSYADNAPLVPFDGNGGSGKTMRPLSDEHDVGISIKSTVNSKEQHDFIENYINNVYDIMYFAAYNDEAYVFNDQFTEISKVSDISPEEAVRRAVNVDSLADMYIVSELTCDADIYWSSFFMDVDLGEGGDKKLTFEAPWDFDSSMGNKKDRCQDGQGMYAANIVSDVNDFYETINPWLAVLMNEEWFTDIIAEKWTALYDGGTFSRMCSMVQDDAKQYKTAFERNYSKWNNIIDNDDIINELSERSAKCRDQQDAADYLDEWLNARIAYLNGYWHK